MAGALLNSAWRGIRGEGSVGVWSAQDVEGVADHG